MELSFSLPHVFFPGSHPAENAEALRALLDCLIQLDLAYLRDHAAPALYQSGVRYGRTETFDTIPEVMAKGYGDCKSLTAWAIAKYRANGIDANPVFRWIHREDGSGELDFHILVQTIHGFEDPSKVLGMPE